MKRTRWHLGMAHLLGASLLIAPLTSPMVARAYELGGVGGSLGYSNPQDLDGTAALGLHAEIEKPGARVQLLPNIEVLEGGRSA